MDAPLAAKEAASEAGPPVLGLPEKGPSASPPGHLSSPPQSSGRAENRDSPCAEDRHMALIPDFVSYAAALDIWPEIVPTAALEERWDNTSEFSALASSWKS